MKVAFFHDSKLIWSYKDDKYYTNGGLTNNYLQRYLSYFDSLIMVTRREKMNNNDDINRMSLSSGENISFECVDGIGVRQMLKGALKSKIREVLKEVDFAIIRLPSVVGAYACVECNRLRKPYIVEMVASPFCALWYYGKLSYKIIAPFNVLINRHLIKRAHNVIYVTDKYLQQHYPNKQNCIGVSDVNVKEFDDSIVNLKHKKILSHKKSDIYKIGLIGSMDVKYKGHDIAIKSIPVLEKNGIGVEMHFLGKCSEKSRDRLASIVKKNRVDERVFFDGVLSGDAVYKWIDDKDFIILPSKQEGLPRSIIEAMSRASVCVGARTGGIPELLLDDCIMKHKDARSLAKVIDALCKDKKKMIYISQKNYEAARRFHPSKLEKKRDKFFKDILTGIAGGNK